MIGFMPAICPDELVYSWFCRYYAHSGHSAYVFAVEDILQNRNIRTDIEFVNRLNEDFKSVILSMMPMEELILNHTMFPYFRFAGVLRLSNALRLMASTGEDAHQLLPVQKGQPDMQRRHIRYCPKCAVEAREKYGEAYWARSAVMRSIGICVKHKCRLKETRIEISGKQSGRLYVAEEEIRDTDIKMVDDRLELKFAKYMREVFYRPINFNNSVSVGDFLKSKLEGTKYLSVRGMRRNVSLLFKDLTEFYREMKMDGSQEGDAEVQGNAYIGISQIHQLQHLFSGKNSDFYQVCQLAFFLGISPDELVNPVLPAETQTELYNATVEKLYSQGLGCYRIAREIGGCPTTVRHANAFRKKKPHDYSAARLGKQKKDWKQYDMDMLPEVKRAAEQIYSGNGGRPKRVTVAAVAKCMGWPNMRMEYYMPKCKELVDSFFEEYPVYWAREVVWCYQQLRETKNEDNIIWRNVRDVTNLRKSNFQASFSYLNLFTDEDTAEKIKRLV